VCPHSRFTTPTDEEAFWPRQGVHGAKLTELMSLSQEEFSRRFKGSPVKRAKRRGLLRNVAVALGNWGSPEAVPVLSKALSDDEPLIRGHAAWALGRIASGGDVPPDVTSAIGESLVARLFVEEDEAVREELGLALAS
jgi:epoxyqueuosine reductase